MYAHIYICIYKYTHKHVDIFALRTIRPLPTSMAETSAGLGISSSEYPNSAFRPCGIKIMSKETYLYKKRPVYTEMYGRRPTNEPC